MSAVILAYHSHHVLGPHYAVNDHIAFAADLPAISRAGYRVVPLATVAEALVAGGRRDAGGDSLADDRLVALTFDDGPVFDIDDFVHPDLGLQRSFVNAMRDFLGTPQGASQTQLCATSFVIASPEARRIAESTYDAVYTYLLPGALTDEWWQRGIDSGLLSIANHSWDHLHPALPRVAHSQDVRADFTRVLTDGDADAEILAASLFLAERTGGRAAPHFAYPFGHCNDFLVGDYLPRRGVSIGVTAAVTTEPRPVRRGDSPFRLPRYVCGDHWRTPEQLAAILASAAEERDK